MAAHPTLRLPKTGTTAALARYGSLRVSARTASGGGERTLPVKNVVVVAGHAGSGKTEFSKQLAARTGWALLDKDTLTRPLVETLAAKLAGDPHDRHSAEYLQHIRPLEYEALLETMWEVLEFGADGVVVTAPFVKELFDPAWIDDLAFDCEIKGASLTVVWVHCDHETLQGRIVARGAARDRWKLVNWSSWAAGLDEPRLRPEDVRVDNSADSVSSLSSTVDDLVMRLKRA